MKSTTTNPKKIASFVIVAVLAIALILGATFALKDYNQHKTNALSGTNKNLDVTLNDEFEPVDDWTVGPPVTKVVSVTNVGVATNTEPAFVRLKLTEYMDITPIEYTYEIDADTGQPYRFLTEASDPATIGTFLTFTTSADAVARATALGLDDPNNRAAGPFINVLDPASGQKYYIITRFGDFNGQYGKYLVTGTTRGTVDVVAGVEEWVDKTQNDMGQFEQPTGSDVEAYVFVPYSDSGRVRDYAKIEWGSDVIDFAAWLASGAEPVAKWIDTGDGYFYWGQALQPPSVAAPPANTTSDLLTGVSLIQQPEGSFYYSLRVDMETVIWDQIDKMDAPNPPDEIHDAWEKQNDDNTGPDNGDGTEAHPYIISTVEELATLAERVNNNTADPNGGYYADKYYKLGGDIDLDGVDWTPIGTQGNPFKGGFDGDGKEISNLNISGSTPYADAGLFGYADGAKIKNVDITGAEIKGDRDAGILAGEVHNCEVTNCSVAGGPVSNETRGWNVGGLIGSVYGSTISGCSADAGDISAVGGAAGGLIGGVYNDSAPSTIEDCFATGAVWTTGAAGGLIGIVLYDITINRCYATGVVISDSTTSADVGGLIGSVNGLSGAVSVVSNCYATGYVMFSDDTANSNTGGLVGQGRYLDISNCYAASFLAGGGKVGGIIGFAYNDVQVSGCAAFHSGIGSSWGPYADGVGRIVGVGGSGLVLSNNVAWDEMGGPLPGSFVDKGPSGGDGADMDKSAINTDGTIGGRFTGPDWVTAPGELPGIGGTVEMPSWLQ